MFRWPTLVLFLGYDLLEVAKAMADGSYWNQNDGDARDCGSGLAVDRSWT